MSKAHQAYKDKTIDRKDHVWIRIASGPWRWKCALCGAVTAEVLPPGYPTDPRWYPARYERLTDEERDLVPFKLRQPEAASSEVRWG